MNMKDNIAHAAKRTFDEFQKRLPEQTKQAKAGLKTARNYAITTVAVGAVVILDAMGYTPKAAEIARMDCNPFGPRDRMY